jgi:hypothetical protein
LAPSMTEQHGGRLNAEPVDLGQGRADPPSAHDHAAGVPSAGLPLPTPDSHFVEGS